MQAGDPIGDGIESGTGSTHQNHVMSSANKAFGGGGANAGTRPRDQSNHLSSRTPEHYRC
ncbi:hypothetical protein GCM10022226_07160 [Sphaerisporangium flaviroseum]|uniref:Uncharacterized protein n=1 Tax=Sphaerisporangium flaviroseum TaxID=509199 RepID=A0ABP7HHL6_9ACTN